MFNDEDVAHIRAEIDAKQEGRRAETPEELKARLRAQHQSITGHEDPPNLKVVTVGDGYGKAKHMMDECIATGEPIFVFRAKDIFSTMVLTKYLEIVESYGPDDYDFQETIGESIQAFKTWQKNNVHKVRYPD